MEWLEVLNKTIKYIEDNLTEDLDISTLSKSVYVSPYYLQKIFQVVSGYTLGEYVRNRRLYESAERIANGKDKILDIALLYGYETAESFSKAFTRFHGVTPSTVRKDRSKIKTFVPLQIRIEIEGGFKMQKQESLQYEIASMPKMELIGFEREFNFETGYREIPKFWDEVFKDFNYAMPKSDVEKAMVKNGVGEFGVCIDDLGKNKFRYLIAGRYKGGEIPDGMIKIELPEGEWAKFKCIGKIPDALQSLNDKLFKEWLPNSTEVSMRANYNLEWYSDKDMNSDDYESGIWFPITRK